MNLDISTIKPCYGSNQLSYPGHHLVLGSPSFRSRWELDAASDRSIFSCVYISQYFHAFSSCLLLQSPFTVPVTVAPWGSPRQGELRDQRFADGSLAVSAKFGAADLSAVAGVQVRLGPWDFAWPWDPIVIRGIFFGIMNSFASTIIAFQNLMST